MEPPKFPGFAIATIIQFHQELKHFRAIRFLGRDTNIIMDGNESQRIIGTA